jgi:hypothetical protein
MMLGGHPDAFKAMILTQKGHKNAHIKVRDRPAQVGGQPRRDHGAWRAA